MTPLSLHPKLRWFVLLVIAGIAFSAWPAAAQVIIDPPPVTPLPAPIPPWQTPPQVTVSRHAVEAVVDGQVAAVHVTQTFRNDSARTAEGVYLFPLPKDASVSDFQMTVNGTTLEGRLLTREEARRIYEEIVRRQLDPALLEYVDRDVFQASVFPIPPGETRTVELSYVQVLPLENGLYRFNYPLRTQRYSSAPVEEVSVQVELVDQAGLRTIYSPNYPIRIERVRDDATVTFGANQAQPEQDFDLYFGSDASAIGLNVLSYKPAGEDGYFVLLAAPAVEAPVAELVERDLVLVVDISGSMQGEKMEQARAAAQYVVEHLNPGDRFNLVSFSTAAQRWEMALQPVNAETQRSAARWIDRLRDSGSTDINRALLEALAQFEDAEAGGRPAYVLFLTDGQPTQGETDPTHIVANATNNRPADRAIRLFTFGIGYDVNTDLLDILSQELGGRDAYVQPGERVDEAVSSFYAQISTPVLASVEVDMGEDLMIEELYPYPLPDLFAGEQLVVTGRYRDGGVADITLTGQVNGQERLYVYPERSFVSEGGEAFVARLWATRKIGALVEQVRRNGPDDELIDAIVDLSLRYGIVTPYTSYLVEEPGVTVVPLGNPAAPAALYDRAREWVFDAAESVALDAPSGAAAVAASAERNALQEATVVRDEASQAVRYAGGRTFKLQSLVEAPDGRSLPLWVDTLFAEDMDVTTVAFGSDAYFDLLDDPAMAAWLAISPELVVVTGEGEALRVTTTE